MMIVGVTGHQKREGVDWSWVRESLSLCLQKFSATKALTSLAEGTDQLFAEVALERKIPIVAVIPLDDYESFFSPAGLIAYRGFIDSSTTILLRSDQNPEQAFMDAGRYVVDHSDVLFAVWDGHHAEGLGGTGDIVGYAQSRGKDILHLNPCNKSIILMGREDA